MTLGFLFWLLVILATIFGLTPLWPNAPEGVRTYGTSGGSLLILILIILLGISTYGWPIRG